MEPKEINNVENEKEQQHYKIKVNGLLDPCWSEWFDGLIISPQVEGETILRRAYPGSDRAAWLAG